MTARLALVALPIALAAFVAASTLALSAQEETLPDDAKRAVDALFSGDEDLVRSLIVFRQLPCVASLKGLHPGPQCLTDEAEGTLVDSFPQASCKGFNTRSTGVDELVAELSAPGPRLYGIYRARDDTFLYGDYVAVYEGFPVASSPQFAGGVWLDNGRIAGFSRGCATPTEGFIEAYTTGERVELAAEIDSTPTPAVGALPQTGRAAYPGSMPNALLAILMTSAAALLASAFVMRRCEPSR